MQKTGYKTEMTVRRAFGLYASSPIYVRMCSGCPSYRTFGCRKTQLFTHRKSVKKSQMAVVCALGHKQAAASLTGRLTPPRHPTSRSARAPPAVSDGASRLGRRPSAHTDKPTAKLSGCSAPWYDSAIRQTGSAAGRAVEQNRMQTPPP